MQGPHRPPRLRLQPHSGGGTSACLPRDKAVTLTPMSDLKDRLRADLTTAIKARDEVRSSTLRMGLTAITNAEVSGKQARELTDDDVLGGLTSESKKRREASEAFDGAGRAEMAAKERSEAAVIADYLPEQLPAQEISDLEASEIATLGVQDEGMSAMGKVMGAVQGQTKGRADGGAVAAEVRRQLGCPDGSAPPAATVAVAVAVPAPAVAAAARVVALAW